MEQRESQVYQMVSQRDQEIEERLTQIDELNKAIKKRDAEVSKLNKQILKHKDEKLDIETKLDSQDNTEHALRLEIVALQDQITGKDKAIKQLGETILSNGQENERLSEMVSVFKNRVIVENCFQVQFGA